MDYASTAQADTANNAANYAAFRDRLHHAPLLADGGMGTMLYHVGRPADSLYEELNLNAPHEVTRIHAAFLDAGADLIETNTYGANRIKFARFGDAESQADATNRAGVQIARRAIQAYRERSGDSKPIFIAGAIGPLGARIAPYGRTQPEHARAAFRQQIAVLVENGVDAILCETFTDLNEIEQAILAAREVSLDVPVVASMTFMRDGQTIYGDTPAEVAERLMALGADVIGGNCSIGPSQLTRIAANMRSVAPDMPLTIMPNAGFPERVGGRMIYPATPDYFGEYALALRGIGAAIIGGCCGTTPEHIAAMRTALDSANRKPLIEIAEASAPEEFLADDQVPTDLAHKLSSGKFIVTVEMAPPRSFSAQKVIASAQMLQDAGADMVDISDSPMARMRMSPWAVCHLIQNQLRMETILHFPTRGRNMLRIQGDLLAAHALGIRNVFVMMGDPTNIGDYPDANDKYDIVPSGLMKLIKHNLNTGTDQAGNSIGQPTSFFVGCALNMGAPDLDTEIKTLRKKIESGADFALTQTIYDVSKVESFLNRYRALHGDLTLPLLIGVLPLHGAKHALFLHNEVPGISIPDAIMRRVVNAPDSAAQVGVQIAVELLRDMHGMVQGAYLMPPFGKYEMAAEITEALVGVRQ